MEIPKNVQKFCDYAWNRAKELLDKEGHVMSAVFMLKERKVSVLPAVFEDEEEKAAFFAACSKAAKHLEAEAVVMIAEAWRLYGGEDWTHKEMEQELDNHSDKIEILFLLCMLPSGHTFGKTAVMIRVGNSIALIDEIEIAGEEPLKWSRMKPWGYHEGAEEDNGS